MEAEVIFRKIGPFLFFTRSFLVYCSFCSADVAENNVALSLGRPPDIFEEVLSKHYSLTEQNFIDVGDVWQHTQKDKRRDGSKGQAQAPIDPTVSVAALGEVKLKKMLTQ